MRYKLGEIFEVGSGGTPSKNHPEYYGGSIPWIKTGDLKCEYLYGAEDYITEEGVNNSSAKMYAPDTVLIAMYGATIGATSILKIDACTNQACAAFKKSEKVIPEYLYYFFKSQKERFVKDGVGGAQPNISAGYLKNVEMEVPTLERQTEIVDILDKVNRIIEQRETELEELDNLIKSRFVEMFGDPDVNEKGWKMNTFGDICTVRQGLQIPISKRLMEYEEDCYEYITVAYLHGGKEREYIKSPKATVVCTKDDVLMTRTGNTGMVITGVEGVFHNNFFLIDFDRTKYDKEFLVQYLNLDMIQADIIRRAGTSTIPDLNHGEFYKIKIFEPPINLQTEFNAFVHQVTKLKFEVQKSLDETQTLMDSLMQQYFG